MFGIPEGTLQKIKTEFPAGCRVQLVSMNDPYTRINPGTHSTLGVVYGEDSCRKIGGNTTDD